MKIATASLFALAGYRGSDRVGLVQCRVIGSSMVVNSKLKSPVHEAMGDEDDIMDG